MSNTNLYTFNFLSVGGTDPYEYWGSLVEPFSLGFRLSATHGSSTNLNTGECSIAQTQNLDTNEKIIYIVTDVAMQPYINLFDNNIFFKSWDEEKTIMKERFSFPTLELNQGLSYTAGDYSTLVEDGFATLLEQGTSSELPVATKFSQTKYTIDPRVSNLETPASIVRSSNTRNGQFINSQNQETSGTPATTTTSTAVSGMGGY